MTSKKLAGRLALFGAALGAGLIIGAGATAALAEASPGDTTNHGSAHGPSANNSESASSARTHTVKLKAAAKPGAGVDPHSASRPSAPAVTEASPSATVPRLTLVRTLTPTASIKPAAAQAMPQLPTPASVQRAAQALLANIGLAVQHQIQGIQNNLSVLASDLFGNTRIPVGPPPAQDDVYGNYAANVKYWYYQGQESTCVLMAVAGVIGQLTGTMPGQQAIINEALTTPSDFKTDRNIYNGTGTFDVDAVKLLERHGVSADLTYYTKSQGQLALDDMSTALSDGQGVIVSLHNWTLYNGYFGRLYDDYGRGDFRKLGDDILPSNHSVVVLSVDLTKNVVYINDSAWRNGQGLPVPLTSFMNAWKASNYSTITAQLAAQTSSTHETIAA